MIIDFGKYKGKDISEVPNEYLAWGAVYLSNKWKDIFKEKYYEGLHPKLYKFQVFQDTAVYKEYLSERTDLLQALSLYKKLWGKRKTVYIEDNYGDFIIFPQDLEESQKNVLDFWIESTTPDYLDLELCKELNHNNYRQF